MQPVTQMSKQVSVDSEDYRTTAYAHPSGWEMVLGCVAMK